MARTISLLCSRGDLTVSWQPENDAVMLPAIQKLIDLKVRFFVLKKRDKLVPVEKITHVADLRKVVIPDETLQGLFATAVLTVTGLLLGDATGEIAQTAQDVVDNDTLAVQPVAGG